MDSEIDPAVLRFVAAQLRRSNLTGIQAVRHVEERVGRTPLTVACDIAIFDLLGKQLDQPARVLFGECVSVPRTAVTIGVTKQEDLIELVAQYREWPILKLKLRRGQSVTGLEVVRRIYDGEIWVDVNGGWDLETTKASMPILRGIGVAILEQPLPQNRSHELHELRGGPVQIMVDEDVTGPQSIARLAGVVDVVNVKLAACGGLSGASETILAAQQVGLKAMIGCRSESVASVTAAATLCHLADFADLDGHLDVADDPFEGISIDRGHIRLTDRSGIGAAPIHR
ncbi:mandelate racemase/muconate lactonizing enzyme family protein [Ensifer adhaerens]|uniref:mandelate racemase/muconate lactonizing enzyme family protein n=1 Tax=Ensifer adhaerens TaxID=106592 RepID=UPI003D047A5F